MAISIEQLLPTAQEVLQQAALKEAEQASKNQRRIDALAKEKKALIERLSKPSGMTEEAKLKRAAETIKRAVANGLTEVQVYRFPNALCTDKGRAINQQEDGWENTLTGLPKEIYVLWYDHLRPRGYRIKCQIIDFPDGMPGDVGLTISWGQ